MLTLPLEPTDDLANPAFKDVASCTKWLAQLQLTNLQPAHSQLLDQINEFNRYPMRGLERLNTLELMCETIGYVQDQYARKLIGKPLPLNESEMKVFVAIVQLWQALVLGYQRCLQAYMAGDNQLAEYGALLCHRCLLYSGLAIFEHLRACYEFDPKLWHQLHELYAFAEKQELHLAEVADPLHGNQPHNSCQGIYAKTLLACYARPAELNRSQLQLLDGWLSQWSKTVEVECSYATSKGDAQPLATDLAGTYGLRPVQHITHSETARYIGMVPLSKLLRVKTILLQQGQTPQQLQLGDISNSDDCIEFLTFLHQCWCEDRNTRFGERRTATQQTQLCNKLENIYAHLSGQSFTQPGGHTSKQSLPHKQVKPVSRALHDSHNKELTEKNFPLESWHLENQSILGAQLARVEMSGERLGYNQLIALRSNDTGTFILGATSWMNVAHSGLLRIGVRYLPGAIEPISIRIIAAGKGDEDRRVPALLLQAVPALKTPPSLILPRDCFQPGRVVEILRQNTETQQAKMDFSVEHGIDYERVSFTLA